MKLSERKLRGIVRQEIQRSLKEGELEMNRDPLDPCPECGGEVDYEYQKHGIKIADFHHPVEAYACTECGWVDEENSSVG